MTDTLAGRVCLVTGATSGIGQETALGLARLGARVAIVGRSRERGEAARAAIAAGSGNPEIELLLADLSSQREVHALAARVLARYPALHVLVNNAGIVNLRRETTVDGLEATFAVNQLAYFLLTRLLLERICASAPARIVNVASDAHRFGRLDPSDLQSEKGYAAMRAYGTSKLANILFTFELARRLEGTRVTANCVHPGAVATRLGKNNGRLGRVVTSLLSPVFLSPARGAATSIYVASSAAVEGVSGTYFAKSRPARSSPASRDPASARQLWQLCERLTAGERAQTPLDTPAKLV